MDALSFMNDADLCFADLPWNLAECYRDGAMSGTPGLVRPRDP